MPVQVFPRLPPVTELISYEEFKASIGPGWVAKILEHFKDDPVFPNRVFDSIYPDSLERVAEVHWTPLHVAKRAIEFLVGKNKKAIRVLDVGSGIGKVCLVGAVTTEADFTGIEKSEYQVTFANALAKDQSISNMRCLHGEMANLDWSGFDSFYLFNPFYENRVPEARIGRLTCLSEERYWGEVRVVETKLRALPKGVRVVTYHGFGGKFPESYSRELSEFIDSGPLDLWVKRE